MRVEIYWVDCEGRNRIAIMPRPRGGEWLADEIESLKQQDVDVVVSLLTPTEWKELDLSDEARLCHERGIRFVSFPIPDGQVPAAGNKIEEVVADLSAAVTGGESVAVHCRMGLGRSAIIVGALLASKGVPVDEALSRIAVARGLRVPDTDEQVEWLRQFAARQPDGGSKK